SWPSTNRLLVAKADTKCSGLRPGLAVMGAARGFAIDGHQVELVRPAFCDPGRKAVHEQVRIDAIHDAPQPIGTGNAVVKLGKAAQEGKVRRTPIDDIVVIVAARDGPTHHQKQDLAQRISDLPALSRILDFGKMKSSSARSRGLAVKADKSSIGPSRLGWVQR